MGSRRLPLCAAFAAVALHLPFVVRYDLHFQPDFAISTLMSRAIAFDGERPVFFWGQAYLGTYGCYLTAVLFRVLGVSVPLAGAVSLGIWACGVGLAAALAQRLLGERAGWWAAAAGAIASPYANHYVTQPYTSYESAPVLSILVITALWWATRATGRRTAGGWFLLGLLLGVGWWTTRLFLPSLIAALLAAALVTRWRDVRLGLAALVVAGIILGDSPEIVEKLAHPPPPARTRSFALAPPALVPENVRQAVASLPAYLNGDPRARLPEGATFAEGVSERRDAYAGAAFAPGPIAAALDRVVWIALAGIMLAAAVTAVGAYRERNAAMLALSLVPFLTLAAIGLSAYTVGDYFIARRYWFGTVLVLPLLFGRAIVLAGRSRSAMLRHGARVLGVVLLVSSAVAQARMLRLPDDLANYRLLARDLTGSGEQAVLMTSWNAWVVAVLADGRLDPVATHYNRRPEILARVARRGRLAVVVADAKAFPPLVHLAETRFIPGGENPRAVGPWRWRAYLRE